MPKIFCRGFQKQQRRWCWLCSLTDPPEGNTTLHLKIDIINQRGNSIDVTQHVSVGPRERIFTAADYGLQYTTFVNLTGVLSSLLRSSLTSSAVPGHLSAVQSLLMMDKWLTNELLSQDFMAQSSRRTFFALQSWQTSPTCQGRGW